jgi:hypothetical protein
MATRKEIIDKSHGVEELAEAGGNYSMGTNKLTSLADGVDSGDAVNKGQLDDKQDILAEGEFVDGDKTKLDGIEDGAEVNDVAGEINSADAKTTPHNDDVVGLVDSENSNVLKKLSWANIKATIGASGGYFADGGEAGGADRTLGNTDNYDLGFLTNNTNRLHIDNDGNVGIGTTDPDYKLHISGNFKVTSEAAFTRYGNSHIQYYDGGDYFNYFTHGATSGTTIFRTYNGSSYSEKVRIDNSGNVGIGTTSPSSKLEVRDGIVHISSDSDARFSFVQRDGGESGWIGIPDWNNDSLYMYGPSGSGSNEVVFEYDSSGISKFFTNETERMRITSTGNVGIGTNSPVSNLNLRRNTDGNVFTINRTNLDAIGFGVRMDANIPTLFSHNIALKLGYLFDPNCFINLSLVPGDDAGSGMSAVFNPDRESDYEVHINGNVGIGTTEPTALLHIKAGTASAGTAPIKLTSGTLNTTPEEGAIEYYNGELYISLPD